MSSVRNVFLSLAKHSKTKISNFVKNFAEHAAHAARNEIHSANFALPKATSTPQSKQNLSQQTYLLDQELKSKFRPGC